MKVGKVRHNGEVQVPNFQDVKQTEKSGLEGARRSVRAGVLDEEDCAVCRQDVRG